MKKDKNKEIEELRRGLEPLDALITPPEELSAKNITSLVDGQKQTHHKRGKVIAYRALGSIAAVLALAIGIGGGIHYFKSPAIKKMPNLVANAEQPLSGNSQKDFVDYFTALKADFNKSNSMFNDAHKGAASAAETVEDAVVGGADSAEDFGTTNTQVDGIDEEDIVKNDGRYIYVLSCNSASSLKIIDTKAEGGMKLLSKTPIDYANGSADGMYIYKNYCVVIGNALKGETSISCLTVFDIADKTAPKSVKTFSQSGYFFTSRLIGSRLIFVSQYGVDLYTLKMHGRYAEYESVVPCVSYDGKEDTSLNPQAITILPQSGNYSSNYLVLSSLDLDTLASSKVNTSAVLGAGDMAYCTDDALYVASVNYHYNESIKTNGPVADIAFVSSSNATTSIYKFSLGSSTITLDKSGEIKGYLNNQFSMDEKDGYFRIASTTENEDNKTVNIITVLDSSLKAVGSIGNIAPGEVIKSVRYIGDYGYVVTFEQTDPLFVIDFSKPTEPKIVGEVKLPGFSSYLHPFGGYIVGIGTSGDESGATNGLKISLFDVSNPTSPRELDNIVIPGAYSEAGYNHKLVMDCKSKDIIGFPYNKDVYDRSGGFFDSVGKFCTIKVENGKLKMLASFVNYTEDEYSKTVAQYGASADEDGEKYSRVSSFYDISIVRGTYIGSTLYTCSRSRICSYPLEGGNRIETVDFN